MGNYKEKFGFDKKSIASLSQRFYRISPDDREWACVDDFILWAKATGYEKGVHLQKHIETLPHGPENSYWLNKDEAETKRRFQEKLKQGSDFCRDCLRTCPASGYGCKEWQEYFKANWDERIHLAKKQERKDTTKVFRYEHPDLVREGIVFEAPR